MRWWDGEAWGPYAPPGSFGSGPTDPVSEGSTIAVVSHIGLIIAGVVLALIVRLTEGKRNEFVKHHSSEALNFQLTFMAGWICFLVVFIGGLSTTSGGDDGDAWFFLLFLVAIAAYLTAFVLAIIGAVRASRGEWWRYPVSIRFVRGARPRQ